MKKILFVLLGLCFSLLAAPARVVSEADSLALVDFYKSTKAEKWPLKRWNLNRSVITWNGVIIDAGRVVGLDIPGNNLNGDIPASIANLSELRTIKLANNKLSSLPIEFWNLKKLEHIDLSNNLIKGEIGVNIGLMKNLRVLRLHNNELSGELPYNISNLSKLKELDLSHNNLSGPLPATIGKLSGLLKLNVSNNQLMGDLPEQIVDMQSLIFLDLSFNKFTGLIPGLKDMKKLENTKLTGNEFSNSLEQALQISQKLEKEKLKATERVVERKKNAPAPATNTSQKPTSNIPSEVGGSSSILDDEDEEEQAQEEEEQQ